MCSSRVQSWRHDLELSMTMHAPLPPTHHPRSVLNLVQQNLQVRTRDRQRGCRGTHVHDLAENVPSKIPTTSAALLPPVSSLVDATECLNPGAALKIPSGNPSGDTWETWRFLMWTVTGLFMQMSAGARHTTETVVCSFRGDMVRSEETWMV